LPNPNFTLRATLTISNTLGSTPVTSKPHDYTVIFAT
jgi:hypothetical protein